MKDLPFDSVVVATDERQLRLSVDEFCALPLAMRVRALLEKRVSFFRGTHPVDTNSAMTALRRG